MHKPERGFPPKCGEISGLGVKYLEAFLYAIDQINKGRLGDFRFRLGSFVLDDCDNVDLGAMMIEQINNSSYEGFDVTPDVIIGYIGAHGSFQTEQIAKYLTTYRVTQISYGATSAALKNFPRYPYLLRTLPSDDDQALALVKLFKSFGWTYVQVVQGPTLYGASSAEEFKRIAKLEGICVGESLVFYQDGTESEIMEMLLKHPRAPVILVFGITTYIKRLLQVKAHEKRASNLIFVGGDSWADRDLIFDNSENTARGSITTKILTEPVKSFEKYFSHLHTLKTHINPYFEEYKQSIPKCQIETDLNPTRAPGDREEVTYRDNCSVTSGQSRDHMKNDYSIHVINGVYAVALGLHRTLQEVCGENYTTVCDSFHTRNDTRDVIFNSTAEAEFAGPNNRTFRFVERGGNLGYRLNWYIDGSFQEVRKKLYTVKLTIKDI